MSFIFRIFGFVIGFVVLLAVLSYTRIIQINIDQLELPALPGESVLTGLDSASGDILTGISATGDELSVVVEEPEVSVLEYPYDVTLAVVGEVTQLGVRSGNAMVFMYKVRSGGTVDAVASRRETYAQGNSFADNARVSYVDSIGKILDTGLVLEPGQVVFIETDIVMATGSLDLSGSVGAMQGSGDLGSAYFIMSQSPSCNAYHAFVSCLFAEVSKDTITIQDIYMSFVASLRNQELASQQAICEQAMAIVQKNTRRYPLLCQNYIR